MLGGAPYTTENDNRVPFLTRGEVDVVEVDIGGRAEESVVARRDPQWPEATLLGRVRASSRAELLSLGVPREYPPRRRIIRQWEESRYAALLVAGIVKVVGSVRAGSEALLDIRVGGDLVGEMSALDGQPRSASVVACGAVQARLIRHGDLKGFLDRHPDVAQEISRIISLRLRWANRRRLDFLAHDATTRTARVLVELADTYGRRTAEGTDLGLELTQAEIASIAGVAQATAEKALHAVEHADLIRRGYRRIVVTDLERLRHFAGSD
jgi:CRP/FNR family transcriptional regulator, cyclic AMP receptor protein